MSDALASSFREHLGIRLEGIAQDLQKTGYSALVLVSGGQYFYFRDDQPAPYRANAHFLHFCPLEGPGHLLLLRPEKKPLLATFSPDDFWYEPQRIGDAFWTEGFKIVECSSRKRQISEIAKRLPKGRAAAIGESGAVAEALGLAQNPPALLTRLDWRRAIKTAYEVECISEANRLGAAGHIAAEGAFQDGGSELDIHRTFLAAVGGLEADLPYPTIVGLNEKGAVLHYEGKRADVRNGKSLLIDAGARVRGYASDITRTFAGGAADGRFCSLITAMEGAQQALCEGVTAGRPWAELHHEAHLSLSGVLKDENVINLSPEDAVASGLSRVFFPHGLGHFLGIQVHDVGGHLADPDGRRAPPPKAHPMLRSTRTLEPGHVLTVEPGVYFIEMLLAGWRNGPRSRGATPSTGTQSTLWLPTAGSASRTTSSSPTPAPATSQENISRREGTADFQSRRVGAGGKGRPRATHRRSFPSRRSLHQPHGHRQGPPTSGRHSGPKARGRRIAIHADGSLSAQPPPGPTAPQARDRRPLASSVGAGTAGRRPAGDASPFTQMFPSRRSLHQAPRHHRQGTADLRSASVFS